MSGARLGSSRHSVAWHRSSHRGTIATSDFASARTSRRATEAGMLGQPLASLESDEGGHPNGRPSSFVHSHTHTYLHTLSHTRTSTHKDETNKDATYKDASHNDALHKESTHKKGFGVGLPHGTGDGARYGFGAGFAGGFKTGNADGGVPARKGATASRARIRQRLRMTDKKGDADDASPARTSGASGRDGVSENPFGNSPGNSLGKSAGNPLGLSDGEEIGEKLPAVGGRSETAALVGGLFHLTEPGGPKSVNARLAIIREEAWQPRLQFPSGRVTELQVDFLTSYTNAYECGLRGCHVWHREERYHLPVWRSHTFTRSHTSRALPQVNSSRARAKLRMKTKFERVTRWLSTRWQPGYEDRYCILDATNPEAFLKVYKMAPSASDAAEEEDDEDEERKRQEKGQGQEKEKEKDGKEGKEGGIRRERACHVHQGPGLYAGWSSSPLDENAKTHSYDSFLRYSRSGERNGESKGLCEDNSRESNERIQCEGIDMGDVDAGECAECVAVLSCAQVAAATFFPLSGKIVIPTADSDVVLASNASTGWRRASMVRPSEKTGKGQQTEQEGWRAAHTITGLTWAFFECIIVAVREHSAWRGICEHLRQRAVSRTSRNYLELPISTSHRHTHSHTHTHSHIHTHTHTPAAQTLSAHKSGAEAAKAQADFTANGQQKLSNEILDKSRSGSLHPNPPQPPQPPQSPHSSPLHRSQLTANPDGPPAAQLLTQLLPGGGLREGGQDREGAVRLPKSQMPKSMFEATGGSATPAAMAALKRAEVSYFGIAEKEASSSIPMPSPNSEPSTSERPKSKFLVAPKIQHYRKLQSPPPLLVP